MRRRIPEDRTLPHQRAAALVAYLDGVRGHVPDTNRAIAVALGMSNYEFATARRHTLSCPSLGGQIVSYRRRLRPLVLLDPNATAVLVGLLDRTGPMFGGIYEILTKAETARRRMVSIVEAAAKEALTNGDGELAEGLGFAADDLARYGEVQPATVALLKRLKALA